MCRKADSCNQHGTRTGPGLRVSDVLTYIANEFSVLSRDDRDRLDHWVTGSGGLSYEQSQEKDNGPMAFTY
jgi:hypothetical protein